ncbi:MAG: hypothetical protein EZS28_003100, partial [Streblomastix strix]
EEVMASYASPKDKGVTLELQTRDTLVQHGEWNKEQKKWTSNKKEMEAIYLGLFRYGQIFRELQIEAILIKSDNSTTVLYLVKQRAGQTLIAKVKKIVKLCQQLRIHTQTQHSPGKSNNITDALSRLSTQGDYSVKIEIFIALCQAWQIILTLDLFATGGKQIRAQIHSNVCGRRRGRMVRRVFEIMDGGDLLDLTTNSEDWKSPNRLRKVQTKINHNSTLVARSNMVHTLTNRQQQIPYSWRELSYSVPREGDDQEEGHVTIRKNRGISHRSRVEQGRKLLIEFLDNVIMAGETQQMIIEGQKYNNQKKYMQTMGVFDDWTKEKNFIVEDIMSKKIPFTRTEFMT